MSSSGAPDHIPNDFNSVMFKIYLAKGLGFEAACLEENLFCMLLITLHIIKDFQPVESIAKTFIFL